MNTDSHFLIGHTHNICQDFASTGNFKDKNGEEYHYAIVSDGCSSSKDVDIGARIITKVAERVLKDIYNKDSSLDYIADSLKNAIIFTSKITATSLSLSSRALDATLLIAISNKQFTDIFVYGDGIFMLKHKDNILTYSYDYTSGAPFYISYSLDKNREKNYLEEMSDERILTISNNESLALDKISESIHDKSYFRFNNSEIDFVSLASDGLNTFHINKKNDNIPLSVLIEKINGFKNTAGEFVKRRLRKFITELKPDDIIHDDDISLASIYLGE